MQPTRSSLLLSVVIVVASGAVAVTSGCSSKSKRLNFSTTPPATVVAGTAYSYQATATGSNNAVTFSLTESPAGMSVDATGLVTWAPAAADVGSHRISLRAVAGSRSGAQTWTLTVQAMTPARLEAAGSLGVESITFVHWRDSRQASGQVPEAALGTVERTVAGVADGTVCGFGWVAPDGRPDLTSFSYPEWNSWSNPETRVSYLRMLEAFVAAARPRAVFVGNALPASELGLSPGEVAAWREVVAAARLLVESGGATAVLSWPLPE